MFQATCWTFFCIGMQVQVGSFSLDAPWECLGWWSLPRKSVARTVDQVQSLVSLMTEAQKSTWSTEDSSQCIGHNSPLAKLGREAFETAEVSSSGITSPVFPRDFVYYPNMRLSHQRQPHGTTNRKPWAKSTTSFGFETESHVRWWQLGLARNRDWLG